MKESKSSISEKDSYANIGEYWDSHDLGEVWDKTETTEFEVDLKSDVFYYPVETSLSEEIDMIAKSKGVSAGKLVDLWLREKVGHEIVK
jgi:hypothetical protein